MSGNKRPGFIGIILQKADDSPFPANTIYKRLHKESYWTRDEAIQAAQDYMTKNGLA